VRIASVSFFDESLGLLARHHPLDEIRRRVRVENIDPADRRLLNDIVQSRSRERRLADATDPQAASREVLLDEYERLIEASPAAAVSRAWQKLEHQLKVLGEQHGSRAKSTEALLRELADKGIVKPETTQSILGLVQLRNLAVHSPESGVTKERAKQFVAMVGAISWSVAQETHHADEAAEPS
jgi:hypothetical protein